MFNHIRAFINKPRAKERYDVCLLCPLFSSDSTKCKACGCFMKAKVLLPNAKCPLGKW